MDKSNKKGKPTWTFRTSTKNIKDGFQPSTTRQRRLFGSAQGVRCQPTSQRSRARQGLCPSLRGISTRSESHLMTQVGVSRKCSRNGPRYHKWLRKAEGP
eukprot:12631404-Heterocapsa_arctica.AAC.1